MVDIVFTNNQTGYVLGNNVYKTTDGGLNWNKLSSSFSTPINMVLSPDGKVFVFNRTSTIYRSVDGGASFSAINAGGSEATDGSFIDANNGYSITTSGLVKSSDGGSSWVLVTPSTGLSLSSTSYNTCSITSASTGCIATGADIYKSNGSLNSWIKSSFSGASPTDGRTCLYAISASAIYAGNGNGKIFKSTDGGAVFTYISTLTYFSNYLDLHFIDATTGYASIGRRIYKTVDGGQNWQVVVVMGESIFTEIYFTDASHGWACTNKGEILRFN